jgi:hypothetical protein
MIELLAGSPPISDHPAGLIKADSLTLKTIAPWQGFGHRTWSARASVSFHKARLNRVSSSSPLMARAWRRWREP